MSEPMQRVVMAQKVRLGDADRSFDIAFWQAQSSSARLSAAWEMVVFAHRPRNGEKLEANEFRLQRTVADLKRQQR